MHDAAGGERERSAGVEKRGRSAPVDRSAGVKGQAAWGGARESLDAPAQVLDRYTSVMVRHTSVSVMVRYTSVCHEAHAYAHTNHAWRGGR